MSLSYCHRSKCVVCPLEEEGRHHFGIEFSSTSKNPAGPHTTGLKENGLHRLIYLNAWFPVGGTVWEGLEGVPLLEEVYHKVGGVGFEVLIAHDIPS